MVIRILYLVGTFSVPMRNTAHKSFFKPNVFVCELVCWLMESLQWNVLIFWCWIWEYAERWLVESATEECVKAHKKSLTLVSAQQKKAHAQGRIVLCFLSLSRWVFCNIFLAYFSCVCVHFISDVLMYTSFHWKQHYRKNWAKYYRE